MNARRTASLVLKLIGIFILVKYLGYLPMVLGTFNLITSTGPSRLDTFIGIVISAGTPLLYLVASILIVIKSEAIARRVAPDEQMAPPTGIDADTIQTLAFCIVGLVFLTGALPRFAQFATNYFMVQRMPNQKIPYTLYGQLIGTMLQIVIGVVLFLQADGLTGLWKKLREAKGIQNS
jgi:membrane protein insertase Oxa1/YidC/SpoIIIJ